MPKPARAASWKDIKTVLSQQSMPELLQLIRDLYALRPEVKDFLHARFLTSEQTLAPYKHTIHQSLYPDVIHGDPWRCHADGKRSAITKKPPMMPWVRWI
jgi:hypothetical protein